MDKLDELKEQIRQSLDHCNVTDTPNVCATKSDKAGYDKIEQRIIQRVLNNNMTIGHAILSLENELNPNTID